MQTPVQPFPPTGHSRAAPAAVAAALVVCLAGLAAVSPPAALLSAPLLVVIAVVASRATVRGGEAVGLVVLGAALTLLAAARPVLALIAAPIVFGAAFGLSAGHSAALVTRHSISLALRRVVLLATALCLALAAAVWPGPAVLAAVIVFATAFGLSAGHSAGLVTRRSISLALRRIVLPLVLLAVALGMTLAAAAWPATASLAAIVALILLLAWRSPPLALAAALLLFGFEGSVKLLLSLEPTPLPFSFRAVGAAAIDLALFAAVAGVLVADRGRSLRTMWAATSRAERIALAALTAWFVLSIVQIAQGGDIRRGVSGFRLFELYAVLAVAGAVVFARGVDVVRAARVLLGVGLLVSAYATFRVVVGAAASEEAFAISVESVTSYGGVLRAIGSFSSSVGMDSFLVPMGVFGLVSGLLTSRLRVLGLTVAALCGVGIVGSYARAPLLGVTLALVAVLVVVALAADVPARRKLAAAVAVLAFVAATYGGVQLVSRAAPELQTRAQGILNPLEDESLQLRFETWKSTLRDVADHPLGRGVGTVGSASAKERVNLVTTDNSFLKVLYEQGIPVAIIFFGGLLALLALVARRLLRVAGEHRAVGLAALGGFVAFLGLATMGEYIEQPGKALAWGLLGVAVAQAFGSGGTPTRAPADAS